MNIIYRDSDIAVCIKPAGVLSTDEPGGMPDLIGQALSTKDTIYVVHRLDQAVSGLMVYALNQNSAANLSAQIAKKQFQKTYLAAIHGKMTEKKGRLEDLLFRDRSKNKTYLVKRMRKGVRAAALDYEVLDEQVDFSLIKIHLVTGRTHQIRAQFAGRQHPLIGDKKYGGAGDDCNIALWSQALGFLHPKTGKKVSFQEMPPNIFPWNLFAKAKNGVQNQTFSD